MNIVHHYKIYNNTIVTYLRTKDNKYNYEKLATSLVGTALFDVILE